MALPARAGGSRRSDQIPVFDPRPDIEVQRTALLAAIGSVLDSGRFILGPQVEAIEAEVAAYLGMAHAVGVKLGHGCVGHRVARAGGGSGDEVVTPSFTFFATPEAVTMVGATPVFVDIDLATFTIDPAAVDAAITERTKAILPVHLFGLAADMDAVLEVARRHDVAVVEDLAQAMGGSTAGRKLGTLGDAAALSFFPRRTSEGSATAG